MRKLKLQVQMTLDGFIAGPNGEMDWLNFNWSEDLVGYVQALTDSIDTILLGKNLAHGFIPHWADVAASPDNPEYAAGKKFTDTPKIVFSKTLHTSEWENTRVASGDVVEEIAMLKKQAGEDIIVYGGATFVASLVKANIIDEMHLFINPTATGSGMSIFKELTQNQSYKLVVCKPFECGIVVLRYDKQS